MLNPDREKSSLQQTLVKEIPKKNEQFPHWLRNPAFALRTSLALLTATPALIIASDVFTQTKNFPIVYYSSQDIAISSQHNFDLLPQPIATPTEILQPPLVYKIKVCMDIHDKICTGTVSNGEYIFTDSGGGNTGIKLKAGQDLEISASGEVLLQGQYYQDRYATDCKSSLFVDPDGNRHWQNKVCSADGAEEGMGGSLSKAFPQGSLLGSINKGFKGGFNYTSREFIGSHWRGKFSDDGELQLEVNYGQVSSTSGGFDISVKVYPLPNVPVLPKFTTTPETIPPKEIPPIISTGKNSDQYGWLWDLGIGAALLAGLMWGIYRWRRKKPSTLGSIGSRTGGGTGANTKVPPGLSGGVTGGLGSGPNPNRPQNPNMGPNLGPNVTSSNPNSGPARPKNPEWIIGQIDFKRRWQDAKSKLSPVRSGDNGNEPEYVLDRFKAGMNIIQEVSLDDITNVPEIDTRVRAGIEFLIPEIWPSDRIFKGFFDPKFNTGFFTPEDLAKIIYLPESYRNLSSFTKSQKRDVNRIRRTLLHALHPDLLKSDADPKLQDSIDTLLRQLNSSWPLINKLIS